jgi:hypothetical protein
LGARWHIRHQSERVGGRGRILKPGALCRPITSSRLEGNPKPGEVVDLIDIRHDLPEYTMETPRLSKYDIVGDKLAVILRPAVPKTFERLVEVLLEGEE